MKNNKPLENIQSGPQNQPPIMEKTAGGLKFMSIAYLLFIIWMGITMITGLLSVMEKELYETFVGVLCGGLIIGLIAVIFFIIGILKLNSGKKEYTKKHAKSVKIGLIFLILGIIMIIIWILIPFVFIAGSMGTYAQGGEEALESSLKSTIYALQISSILTTLFFSLMSIFLIVKLASSKIKKLLWIAGGVAVSAPVVGFAYFIKVLKSEGISTAKIGNFHYLTLGLSVFGFILFLIAYFMTYKRVKNGEINPPRPPPRPKKKPAQKF